MTFARKGKIPSEGMTGRPLKRGGSLVFQGLFLQRFLPAWNKGPAFASCSGNGSSGTQLAHHPGNKGPGFRLESLPAKPA